MKTLIVELESGKKVNLKVDDDKKGKDAPACDAREIAKNGLQDGNTFHGPEKIKHVTVK